MVENNAQRKIVLIGDGAVGSAYAFSVAQLGLANEFVIINKENEKSVGDVLDLEDATPFTAPINFYAGSYDDCKDADLVVICAGAAQKPGESRLSLVGKNLKIMRDIAQSVVSSGFNGIILVAANPVDILTAAVQRITDFPTNRVIGSGTSLDSARLQVALGKKLHLAPSDVPAYMMGEHGDSEFAAYSTATVGGASLLDYAAANGLTAAKLTTLENNVRRKAYQIINRKGATYYGVATALARITKAIFSDENAVLSVSAYLDGEYGLHKTYIGTPAIINREGISRVVEVPLNKREKEAMSNSASVLQKTMSDAMTKVGMVNYLWD